MSDCLCCLCAVGVWGSVSANRFWAGGGAYGIEACVIIMCMGLPGEIGSLGAERFLSGECMGVACSRWVRVSWLSPVGARVFVGLWGVVGVVGALRFRWSEGPAPEAPSATAATEIAAAAVAVGEGGRLGGPCDTASHPMMHVARINVVISLCAREM